MVILNPVRLTIKINPERDLGQRSLFAPGLGQVVQAVPYEAMALLRP